MKNTFDRLINRLDITEEEKRSELGERPVGIIQTQTQRCEGNETGYPRATMCVIGVPEGKDREQQAKEYLTSR